MKTKKFEQRMKESCGTLRGDWAHRLCNCNRFIKKVSKGTLKAGLYADKSYDAIARFEIILDDGNQIVTIAQNGDELEFFYFGVTPNEDAEECLDYAYERTLIMDALKRKHYQSQHSSVQ
jgi:hypothetical protein